MCTKFHTVWKENILPDPQSIDWDFDPVPGFQDHMSEPISVLLQRYAAGDLAVYHPSVDATSESMFEDPFDAIDRYSEMESLEQAKFSAESSASGRRAHPSDSSQADKPGDSDTKGEEGDS